MNHEAKNIIEEEGFVIEEYKTLWDDSDRSDYSTLIRLYAPHGGIWTLYYFTSQDETIRMNVGTVNAALKRFPNLPEKIKFFLWSLL